MARLAIRDLRKFYGKFEALKGINLDIAEGEFCVFVGPSGCGKSTLLRSIAGLEDVQEGTIEIDGEIVNNLRPRDRNVAMVFQNYALYPYLNVFENIAFGLRARKVKDTEVRRRVAEAAEMLGIDMLMQRFPRELSGGQRQRVAIGRAVVRDARVFLFDEPLSNLDAQLRDGMRAEIKRLHQEIGKTTIYVTHDQIEAMTLADRIILLRDGMIEQQGAPLDLFERPDTQFVAGFLGSPQMNFVDCRVIEKHGALAVEFEDGRSLKLDPSRAALFREWLGRPLTLGLRPEHISRNAPGAEARPGEDTITVLIDLVQPTGTRTYAQFRLGRTEMTVELPSHAVDRPGATIELLADMSRAVLIDPDTRKVIGNGGNGVHASAREVSMTAGPKPSNAVRLFGTEEPAEPMRILKAGPLEASFDAGNLRYIGMGGKEALRAVAFIVRDRNWGTYNPAITNLTIREENDRFTVGYDAVCRDDRQAFRYSATITGEASGALSFAAEGEALTDFETNRTGFVVLHALEGVVGAPVKVEHTDGRIEESRFPERIDPDCPFRDIRALTHDVSPGLSVTCRMEGDAFEMEDHRNWMDASYKTYIRPLAKPWPYTISKGEKTAQSVTLSFDGQLPAPAVAEGASETTVTVGGPLGHDMPRLGLAAPPEHNEAALAKAELLRAAAPSFLVCHFDARKGHGSSEMQGFAALGKAIGCELVLEAIVPCLDASGQPTDDPAILKRDMAAIREAAEGVPFARIAVSPASDLKCTLPGSVFPPAPSWEALFASARAAFPGVPVGGGMFSYFTELNRKRPPAGVLDFICHSGSPIVHAGDDISVTETLEALPWIFSSVQAIAGGKPYWVFPTAISMRGNPYGAAPAENPDNIRQAMNRVDPRERGLLGAAWYAGYLAHAARAGVDAVTLAATAGPSGIVHARQDHVQPWFDETQAAAMPVYSVVAGHMGLAGCRVRESRSSTPREVQALASSGPAGPVVWLSNLTGEARTVRLDGVNGAARMRILDADNFEVACREPAMLPEEAASPDGVVLAPYAVAALRFPEA